ncbi:MAG: serine hydrolase [Bacteroidales bacterium]|nr:serine hydrolase [Bacteroidales bacterium]
MKWKLNTLITFFAITALLLQACCGTGNTVVKIKGDKWYINGKITNIGSQAEGLLMNVRMVNSSFEDRGEKIPEEFAGFDPDANTKEFISKIPEYTGSGANAFTLSLQGGSPGYEGAVNSAFNADGSLRPDYLERISAVIEAVDAGTGAVILTCFYQRQHSNVASLQNREAMLNAVRNTALWIKENGYRNVLLEISNEYRHNGFLKWNDGKWLVSTKGQLELIAEARKAHRGLLVSTSGMGDGRQEDSLARAVDYITVHFNTTPLGKYAERINALRGFGKPVICNEDDKTGKEGAAALLESVLHGCGWGYMNNQVNQTIPFVFGGVGDDLPVYEMMKKVTSPPAGKNEEVSDEEVYFPPPDGSGGWRTLNDPGEIFKTTGIDKQVLDSAFEFVRTTTRNGGLLVLRHGWLVYENYFGKGQSEAAPNLASCGKSFTSVAAGIVMSEHPELFPEGLDQKVFTSEYFPDFVFPLADTAMSDIKIGELLSFSAGIRGNNPVYVNGQRSSIDPVGPDGWYGMTDSFALGLKSGSINGKPFTTATLWCEPGGGYSYATASIHIASIMVRHLAGMELEDYLRSRLAIPMGWSRWGYGYKSQPLVDHTPGGGGIALRGTDMLRFGYLLLNRGRWGEKQLVPEAYIETASKATAYNPHFPYSLQFNVNTNGQIKNIPSDAFWKTGSGGHCLYVVPSLDLVIWKLGGRDGQYGSSDTGLPQPEPVEEGLAPTEKISATLDGTEYTRLLEMVIRSIKE